MIRSSTGAMPISAAWSEVLQSCDATAMGAVAGVRPLYDHDVRVGRLWVHPDEERSLFVFGRS